MSTCGRSPGPRAASKKRAIRRRTVSLAGVLGGHVQFAGLPCSTDPTQRREDNGIHGEFEPLRGEGVVEDPFHHLNVDGLGGRDECRRGLGRRTCA